MQLPEELGRLVQSYVRPTQPLFYTLRRLSPTAALDARKAELNLAFERRNWLRYYADEPPVNARVAIFSYTGTTHLVHSPLSEYLRPIFVQRMRDAVSDLGGVHAATCEELHVDYSLVQTEEV
jgi:hypothetical protein